MIVDLIKIIIPLRLHIKPTPEFLILLPIALILDIVGVILLCCGIDDCGILEVLGLLIFGSRLLTKRRNSRMFMRAAVRFGGELLIELVPYLDAIFFGYTFLVLGMATDTNDTIQQEEEEAQEAVDDEIAASLPR